MPKDDDGGAPVRSGRGLRIALALSVALNLAVVGLVIGVALRGPPMPPMAVRDLGFGPFAAALTEDDRRALRDAFRSQKPDLRAERRAMRADLEAVSVALRADPFAPEDLKAALARGAARTADLLRVGQGLLLDHVLAMTPEARQALADRLDAALARGPRDGRGADTKRPDEGEAGP